MQNQCTQRGTEGACGALRFNELADGLRHKKTPGAALGTRAEGREYETGNAKTAHPDPTEAQARLQSEKIVSLILCLKDANPRLAAEVCAEYLAAHRTEGPAAYFWGDLDGEAQLWATAATSPEVTAHTIAGLDRLHRVPLGLTSRRRLFWAFWEALPAEDQRAFVAKVGGEVAA